jgi:hypothetical protein
VSVCARCHAPLDGQEHTGLPAFDYAGYMDDNPDGDCYCSAKCIEATVDERMHRAKKLIRTGPALGEAEPEKWPRFAAEVPPEIAILLDEVQRRSLGVNASAASRANMVRSGLLLYLHHVASVDDPVIDSNASEEGGVLDA